jgi:hypothetical protein
MAGRSSAASFWLAAIASVVWVVHLEIRRPCYPGYVRLIDVAPAVPVVAGSSPSSTAPCTSLAAGARRTASVLPAR